MTFNEEDKIEQCISSVLTVSDEIIVLDSYSTDKTVAIAESLGAIIKSNSFLGYIAQRELSISFATNELVLALDADEYLSEELQIEIEAIKKNPVADVYYLNRLSSINNYWVKHGSWFPHRLIRLFKKSSIRCGGNPPHDKIEALENTKSRRLKGLLMHNCNDDIHDRMNTINKHSSIAAKYRFSQGKKSNYFKVLLKPIWKFFVEYFLRLGFLDGYYGFFLARSTAFYIYMRESKLMEIWKLNNSK